MQLISFTWCIRTVTTRLIRRLTHFTLVLRIVVLVGFLLIVLHLIVVDFLGLLFVAELCLLHLVDSFDVAILALHVPVLVK